MRSTARTLPARISGATAAELPASLWSFVCFFSLLAGYYVLRPIRDEMAIQVGQGRLQELFTAVFLTMLVVAPVFGWLTRTFPRSRLLPWLHAFFVANLLGAPLPLKPGARAPARADCAPPAAPSREGGRGSGNRLPLGSTRRPWVDSIGATP